MSSLAKKLVSERDIFKKEKGNLINLTIVIN